MMDGRPESASEESGRGDTHERSKADASAALGGKDRGDELRFWVRFHLKRGTLLGFALVFACAAIALGVLAAYSKQNNGISSASTHDHYLWTYGPTAFFTLIAVFFAQTEYRAVQLQPWRSMSAGFQPASKSVLLDYVSQWNVLALLRAVRNRHALAALGITGSLLIKVVTILSTGLIVLQDVQVVDHNIELHVTEAFQAQNVSSWASKEFGPSSDFRPAAVVLGLASDNLTLPMGTTMTQSFQRFEHRGQSSNPDLSIQATVDVFGSSLDCERATFRGYWYKEAGGTNETNFNATSVFSKSCTNGTAAAIDDDWSDVATSSSFGIVRCAEFPPNDGVNGMRLLFRTGSVDWKDEKSTADVAALLCFPKYDVYKAPVTIQHGGRATVDASASKSYARSIIGLPPWSLAEAFVDSCIAAEELIVADTPEFRGSKALGSDLGFIFGMLDRLNPQASMRAWSNTTLLNSTLQEFWATWTAQAAALHLKRPANESVLGAATSIQPRLFIHTASFWSIEGALLALFILMFGLAGLSSGNILSRDPASLGGLATIIASSVDFQAALKGSYNCSETALKRRLEGSEFQTSVHHAEFRHQTAQFRIDRSVRAVREPSPNVAKNTSEGWWRPKGTSYAYIAGVSLLTVALIELLEGLYQYSRSHSGLIGITDPTAYTHFAWTTIPALVMTVTTAIVSMQYFAIRVLNPYQALKRGSVPASTGLFRYPFSGARIPSMLALKGPESAVVLAALSVFFASFLTIVVSGLYSPHRIPTLESMPVHQMDWFDHSTTLSNKSPLQTELVTLGNLSFPRFTHQTLAFPRLEVNKDQTGTVNLQIPALQGVMNCSMMPSEDIITVNNTWSYGKWSDIALVVLRDPNQCLSQFNINPTGAPLCRGGPYGSGPRGNGTLYNQTFHGATAPGGLCGSPPNGSVAFSMYPNADDHDGASFVDMPANGYFGYIFGRGHQASCPTSIGVLGKTVDHKVEEATVITCNPFVHKVVVNATFTLPTLEIALTSPPSIVNGPSQPFTLEMPEPPSFGFPDGNPMDVIQEFQLPSTSSSSKLDPFTSVLVYGTRGIPIAELAGAANVDRLLSAADDLWGTAMAQLINDYRHPLTTGPVQLEGTRQALDAYRLVQNGLSTRILEALLAVILICVLIAFFMADARQVVKLNPCSIAGLASLLVDSELLTKGIIPPGAEWLSDKDLLEQKVFDGWVFSLGWWRSIEGEKRGRFGVDVGRADAK